MSDYDNLIRQSFGTANPALPPVVGNISEDPEKASRAYELAKATGAPANAIYGDLDEFERQNKASIASDIVRNNGHIADFVSANPINSVLANDDYGNLDAVSQKTTGMSLPMRVLRAPEALAELMFPGDPFHRFKEGGPLGSWIGRDDNAIKNYPFASAVAAGLGTPIELVLRGLGGVQDTAADAAANILGTVSPTLGREAGAMVQSAGLTGRTGLIEHPIFKAADQYYAGKHYIENGREPPPGVLPEYDAFRAERNAQDVDALGEVVADAQKSLVRERNPDLFRDFIRQHTDAEIGLSGDAVVALYGDKRPLPDDGLLGWVPGIEDKLNLARASGDDVSVPLADWVAKVEPEVMKALGEDIRVRPGAITAREAMLAKEAQIEAGVPPPIPLPEEVPTVRAGSGLEPLFSIGDRKLTLQKEGLLEAAEGQTKLSPTDEFGADQIAMMDEKGNKVGNIEITAFDSGKKLYVDMINGVNGLSARDFGPALMRDVLKQLKTLYPNAETIGGYRVSGVREVAGSMKDVWIKFDNPDMDVFGDILEGGQWETFSPNTRAYIKPRPDVMDREMVNIINEELDRIVPKKVGVQEAQRIESGFSSDTAGQRAGDIIEPSGIYIRYREAYPVILYSLEGPDPIGSARHEAIHHLRNYGFLTKPEWSVLEKAAMDNGWLEQFGVNRRYPTGDHALKLEEAIADAYPKWARGELGTLAPEITTIFERMKALFDAIKKRIGELLGKDPTWEDVFKKVDTGEVGAREGRPLDVKAFDERASVEAEIPLRELLKDGDGGMSPFLTKDGKIISTGGDHLSVANPQERLDQGLIRFVYGKDVEGNNRLGIEYVKGQELNPKQQAVIDRLSHNAIVDVDYIDAGRSSLDERASIAEPPVEPSRVFERANALGMTIDQYKRYEKLIEKRHVEDVDAAQRRVDAAQRKVQTKEWKANRAELRKAVVDEIDQRPDIAADNYFADGILYGEKVEKHEKLGTDFLTEAQRAGLPRDYYRKDGVHPDDLAGLFGFPDGATLVDHLSGLSEIRRQSGMRPIEFKRRMIDIETDRQMRLRYGVLEDNIMDAVKDQVASETQLSLLHEETLYYGMKSGQEPTFDQAAVKAWVAEEFDKSPMTTVSSDRYMAAAGRSGKAVENALLKQDFAGAFREKQKQYYSMLLARQAIELEGQVAKFEKLAARLSKREVKAVEPEYLDFIHGLLVDAAVPVKRSATEIAESKQYHGHQSLGQFVQDKAKDGFDLDRTVADTLWDAPAKPLDQMSVAEMRDFIDAVTSLNHVGRKVRSIEIAGEKADWADWRQKVIDNITKLPERPRASQNRWLYKIDASLTRMEEIAKDLDLRQELGPLHQAVIEPMMRSKAQEFDLMTDLSKHFNDTRGSFDKEWRRSLHDTIPQDVLHDPYTQAPYDMTRENLINVMLNWGNRSNIAKMVQGAAVAKFGRRLTREEFPAFEAQIKGLIDQHARPEDWEFVQRMWEPFKGWSAKMADVSRATNGVAPKMVEIGKVETPHGTFDGGYWPVKYDRLGSNISTIEDRKPTEDGVFGGNYFRAATAKGYLKERTGYVDFVDISTSLEQAAGTMQQTIHDIAFRDSLIQAGKVFYDKGIRAAIRKHYGAEYEAQLVPWLRRIAHQFSTDEASIAGYNDFMRRVRINLVGHALPLNLKVILSPDVGVPNPKAWASYLANRSENTKLAMEKSDEIRHLVYNMDRDYRESLDKITLNPNVGDLQKKAVQWGFVPIAKVSQEFRISTFVDQYHKALGRGKTEAEAALIADSAVRERHGAASVVDLPAVMQSNEAMKMLTMFYGYFNTMYNWQRQLPGNVRRGEAKEFAVNGLGSVVVGAAFGATLFNQRKQDDSWFKIIGKAMLLQPLSTIPVLNTAASYFAEGYAPRTPIASLLGAAGSIITDTKKLVKGQPVEKPVQHVANVVGLSTGLPLAQPGRTGQFAADVYNRKQRPRNIAEWARGIITGESKLKR